MPNNNYNTIHNPELTQTQLFLKTWHLSIIGLVSFFGIAYCFSDQNSRWF